MAAGYGRVAAGARACALGAATVGVGYGRVAASARACAPGAATVMAGYGRVAACAPAAAGGVVRRARRGIARSASASWKPRQHVAEAGGSVRARTRMRVEWVDAFAHARSMRATGDG